MAVSPDHADVYQDAAASVEAQTVRCELVIEHDPERTGAAATRNRALARSSGDFIVFLDADDLLAYNFAEIALEAWRPGCYVVTDHIEDYGAHRVDVDVIDAALWRDSAYHYVTALYPRALVAEGFDAAALIEDADIQMRARWRGWKCVNIHRTLWTYRQYAGRSQTGLLSRDNQQARIRGKRQLRERYPGIEHIPAMIGAVGFAWGNPRAGMLPAHALFEPRRYRGPVTGYAYPMLDDYGRGYVYPEDAAHEGTQYFALTEDVIGLSPIGVR